MLLLSRNDVYGVAPSRSDYSRFFWACRVSTINDTLINWKFIPQKSTTTNENPTILMIHLGPCDEYDEDGEDGNDGGGGSEDDDHLV